MHMGVFVLVCVLEREKGGGGGAGRNTDGENVASTLVLTHVTFSVLSSLSLKMGIFSKHTLTSAVFLLFLIAPSHHHSRPVYLSVF